MATSVLPRPAIETLSFEGDHNGTYSSLLQMGNETWSIEAYTEHDTLALVSGLYGPGTVIAWYLTMLAVTIRWLLHPRKKKTDSLDNDLAASLLLPAVATLDFILQARSLLNMSDEHTTTGRTILSHEQMVAAMKAPFDVLEMFMLLGSALCTLALSQRCFRRGLAVATIILLCFLGECYMHFSGLRAFDTLRFQRHKWSLTTLVEPSSGYYSPKYGSVAGVITGLLPILFTVATGIVGLLLRIFKKAAVQRDMEGHRQQSRSLSRRLHEKGRQHLSFLIGLLIVFLSIVMSTVPSVERMMEKTERVPPWTVWAIIRMSLPSLVAKWVPATSCSIKDLDQAVALMSGGVVLAFSVYGVVKARYHILQEERKKASST